MKNLAKFFVAVAALFVGVSCTTDTTEDLGVQVVGKGQTVITVSTGDGELRTSLGEKADGSYPIFWSEGDVLSLNGVASKSIEIKDGGKVATFTWDGTFEPPFCLAYPASDKGTVTFAAEQSYVEGTFSQNAVPMVAYANGSVNELTLSYLAGVLQFNVTGNSGVLKSVVIETVDGAPIAGKFDYGFQTGEIKAQAGASSSIDYSFGDGLDLTTGKKSFHVAVPAGAYEAVKVLFVEGNGSAMEATLKAGAESAKGAILAGQVREFQVTYEANKTFYVIKDVESLADFAAAVSDNPALEAIVLKDVDASSIAADWAPIEGFTGVLRGNGKTISGLTEPLFGELKGTVSNLTYNAVIAPGDAASATDTSKNLYAIFAKTTNGAKLYNCTTKGSLTINNTVYKPATTTNEFWFAGFAGQSTDTEFKGCTNEAVITITQSMTPGYEKSKIAPYVLVGGISAQAIGACSFVGCSNKNSINYNDAGLYQTKNSSDFYGTPQTNGCIGGILGYTKAADTYLSNCVNDKNGEIIIGAEKAMRIFTIGGVVGKITTSTKGIDKCINNAPISTTSYFPYGQLGGVFGLIDTTTANECKNNGAITVQPKYKSNKQYAYIGGITGINQGTLTGCENHGTMLVEGTFVAKTNGTGYVWIGGVAGYDKGVITSCSNHATITSKGQRGGVYHYAADSKTGAYTGMTESSINAVGGISGYKSAGSISGCVNKGEIFFDVTSWSTEVDFNQPQAIGGIVGNSEVKISECHNEGKVTFPATANINTIAMGGIGGMTASIDKCTNKGKIQLLGTVNGEPMGYHYVWVGGIAGHSGAITNSQNLVGGDVIVSGQIVASNTVAGYETTKKVDGQTVTIPWADRAVKAVFGGTWGSTAIGGISGMSASGTTHDVSNAAQVIVSSNIVAIPQTDDKDNYSMHPVVIGGTCAYMGNSNNYNLKNTGNITISGTHSYSTQGLYVGGVISRTANNGGYTYTGFENEGNITISTKFNKAVNCKVGGILGFNSLCTLKNGSNSGVITITSEAVLKSTLYVGGISAATTIKNSNSSIFDTCNNSGAVIINANDIPGNLVAGGIVGYINEAVANNEMVKDCSNSGAVTVTGTGLSGGVFIGGLTGSQGSKAIKVTGFTNTGAVSFSGTAAKAYVGGVIGSCTQSVAGYTKIKSTGTVTATGSLTATGDYMVGGLAGRAKTLINGWEVNATVSAPEAATCGIVVGTVRSNGVAQGCYVQGKISREGEAEVTLNASNFTDYIYPAASEYNAADACVFGPKPAEE